MRKPRRDATHPFGPREHLVRVHECKLHRLDRLFISSTAVRKYSDSPGCPGVVIVRYAMDLDLLRVLDSAADRCGNYCGRENRSSVSLLFRLTCRTKRGLGWHGPCVSCTNRDSTDRRLHAVVRCQTPHLPSLSEWLVRGVPRERSMRPPSRKRRASGASSKRLSRTQR